MARIETERVLPPPLPLLVVKAAAHLPLSARFYILPHEAETACAQQRVRWKPLGVAWHPSNLLRRYTADEERQRASLNMKKLEFVR